MTSQFYFIYSSLTAIKTHSTPKFLAGNYASGTEDKLFYNIQCMIESYKILLFCSPSSVCKVSFVKPCLFKVYVEYSRILFRLFYF